MASDDSPVYCKCGQAKLQAVARPVPGVRYCVLGDCRTSGQTSSAKLHEVGKERVQSFRVGLVQTPGLLAEVLSI